MKKNLIVPELSLPEKILWTASAVCVTVLFCLVPQKNPLTLIATIVGVTSLLFTAKGHVSGQFLQLVFCVLYAIVALGFKYYGEAITYMGMTFPSDLFAAIVWLKNPSKKGKTEVRMAHLTPKKSAVAISVSAAATVIFYFILKMLYWDRFTAGMAPLLIGMFFLGATQLFFIGLLGEYVLSINTRVLDRPLVVEEERLNFEEKEDSENESKTGKA